MLDAFHESILVRFYSDRRTFLSEIGRPNDTHRACLKGETVTYRAAAH